MHNEVLITISELYPSKSSGADEINANMIELIGSIISPVLAFIFNMKEFSLKFYVA